MRPRRKLGVVISAIHEEYQGGIWHGIVERAKETDTDIVAYVCTSQDGIDHFDVHYDIVVDFARRADVDGFIVFSGSIAEHQGTTFTKSLCDDLADRPVVCLSEPIAGFPCIRVENGTGIEAMIDHLVSHHNMQRIVFVKGPEGHQEAEQRLAAYKRGLQRNAIALRDELIVPGGFIARDGVAAVEHLLQADIGFDAIMTASDNTAFGVLEALRNHGRHVPGDVVVVGFDNVPEAANRQPPMSSIAQPLHQMGRTAVSYMLDRLNGAEVPDEVVLPTEPVFRRSCGCFSETVLRAKAVNHHEHGLSRSQILDHVVAVALAHVFPDVDTTTAADDLSTRLADIIDALVWDVEKPAIRNIFLNEVDILMFYTSRYADHVALAEAVLKELTVFVPSLFSEKHQVAEANNLLQQAQVLVRENVAIAQHIQIRQEQHFQWLVDVTCQRIISTFDRRELVDAMRTVLPPLGIRHFTVALLGDEPVERVKWSWRDAALVLLSYNLEQQDFFYPRRRSAVPAAQTIPPTLVPRNRTDMVFMPLVFRDEYVGYTVLEYNPDAPDTMYEELRLHLSSATKSLLLLRKFKEQSLVDELTGVYNRRGFLTHAGRALRTAKSTGQHAVVVYADVDGLKTINDTFGHKDGDRVICGAAQCLLQTFRERDIVARVGGDEFTVFLWTAHPEQLEAKIRPRFESAVAAFNATLDRPWRLGVSLGFAQAGPEEDITLERLMQRADDLLFEDKRARKARAQR